MPEDFAQTIAETLSQAARVAVFTGAGISTESGIPDFRSPGGVWTRYKPVLFHEFLTDHDARRRYWAMKKELFPNISASRPNAAHLALAELERLGKLHTLITQNIDGLHQLAGNSEGKIIELHGTNRWVACLSCEKRYPADEIQKVLESGVDVPRCAECGGWLKPATISFGQSMPERETRAAEEASRACDAFLVVGSSLEVQPAASMPVIALESGARLIIINLAPTPLDALAHTVWHEKAGTALSRVVEEMKKKL